MREPSITSGLSSISVIVNDGVAHKVSRIAKELGAAGCTAMICRSTVSNRFLESLDLNEDRKELVFILCETHLAARILAALNDKLKLEKCRNGIAFCTEITEVRGMHGLSMDTLKKNQPTLTVPDQTQREGEKMYNSIYTVVDKGKANEVVAIAEKAGSKGGTIFNARGAGIHETSRLFAIEIEPEKEVVLILAEESKTDAIATAIVEGMNLNKPGNGLLYIQKVTMTYGVL